MNIPEKHTLNCAECGRWAATIVIAAPGEPMPERPPAPAFPLERWRVEMETPQQGGMNCPTSAEGAASLRQAVETGDFEDLYKWGRPLAAAICPTCRAFYCEEHQSALRVYESGGSPLYDYYFETTCWKGHRRTFERD